MSKKEIKIEIFEPDKTPIRSNTTISSSLNVTKDYIGLNNQGNTCYLNSLLQALFMTPEFRVKLFHWIYNENKHGIQRDCIPFQIKKLFARMQLKLRISEETKDLTRSFQWDKKEVYIQHDIQELCRVLFDAIESSLSMEEENFINGLFEGETIHIVKCLVCNNESVRSDKFLDLSLPIRNEFLKICNKSLEMAFVNYLKPEYLGAGNEYKCENCSKKVNAEKFLRFVKLPKILFIQLNRFEYDYISMDKKKIYDKLTYPEILNMNKFFHNEFNKINDYFNPDMLKSLNERKIQNFHEDEIKSAIKEGNLVYELYAILSHSGTANSGHYKAYIKSFENGKWYCFDDSIVFEVEKDSFKHIFGGIVENEKACSETPYILMYKLVTTNANENITIIDRNLIDTELINILEEENKQILIEEEKVKERAQHLTLKFYLFDQLKIINSKKPDSVYSLKSAVMNEFGINDIKKDNVRIRAINLSNSQMLEPFKEELKSLEEVNINQNKIYTLEIKRDKEEFEVYDPFQIILYMIKWDDKYSEMEEKDFPYKVLKINRYERLSILEGKIFATFDLEKNTEILIYRKTEMAKNNFSVNLVNCKENKEEDKDITECGLFDNIKLYLEIKDEKWKESYFIKLFNEKTPVVTVHFNLPLELSLIKNKITMNSYKFDNEIEIKKNQTIRELKTRIGDILKLPNKEFIMRKFTHNGQEIKASNDSVEKLGNNSINIFIELGMSLGEDEIKIKVILCEFEEKVFSIFPYRLREIGIFIINTLGTISAVKESICQELNNKYNIILDQQFVMLRDFLLEKPTKVYQDHQMVKSLKFTDSKKICVQEYKMEKFDISTDQMLTTIRIWDPSAWTLSHPREIMVPKKISCLELNQILLKYFPDIKEENLSVYKLVNSNNLYLEDFEKFKFENLFSLVDSSIDITPLFLNSDGNLLIMKDDSKLLREPTSQEIALYCKPKGKYSLKSSVKEQTNNKKASDIDKTIKTGKFSNSKSRIKEQAIHIKVKKEDDKKGPFDINTNVKDENNHDILINSDYYNSDKSNIVKYSDEQIKIINEISCSGKMSNNIEIQIFSKNVEDIENIKDNLNDVNEVYQVDDLKKK